ncbi:MAG: NADH-quinone oxidoreductase subunit N [Deltaproteobacteria bacterium]|nr:NADH-quinone oxidoreductase subunit N [Deltaproteobacteria bacterium]
MDFSATNYMLMSPELLLCGAALVILTLDFMIEKGDRKWIGYLCAITMVAVIIEVALRGAAADTAFFELYVQDGVTMAFKIILGITALLVILMSIAYADKIKSFQGEFYVLSLFAALGMFIMASAADFMSMYVALELTTITFYILAAYLRDNPVSLESGMKYLILGAMASGVLLYGVSFIYGVTGSTNYVEINKAVSGMSDFPNTLKFGVVLVIAGLSFKIAAVPFHIWAPDVYEGAPTPVTAFLAVGSKVAGVAVLMRVLFGALLPMSSAWIGVLSGIAAISMIFGNLAAIPQKSLKRLIAYAGIGSAGYIFMALAAASKIGAGGTIYYLAAYLFSTLGAFLVLILVSNLTDSDLIEDFNGLARKAPYLAATVFIGLMSLAGVPPLGGFIGKLYLLMAIVEQKNYLLAFVGAIMAVVTLYYFILVIKAMYMREPKDDRKIPVSVTMKVALTACNVGVLYLGVYPGPVTDFAIRMSEKVFF